MVAKLLRKTSSSANQQSTEKPGRQIKHIVLATDERRFPRRLERNQPVSSPESTSGREAILMQLYALFRRAGYTGVSIADIADATGVGRSSLYHHFPGGKADMAAAVLDFAKRWLQERIVAALRQDAPFQDRIEAMLDAVEELYSGGEEPCIVASMMLGSEDPALQETLSSMLIDWLAALRAALIDSGVKPEDAERRAAEVVARIEGGLLLSRALDNRKFFKEALDSVRNDIWA